MNSNLIRDITSHILNAPDRATAAGKGIRILAKMHARKDRETDGTKEQHSDGDSGDVRDLGATPESD